MNIWHDVHYGDDAPNIVTAVVEISNRSRAKYEIDKETGLLHLDRILFSPMHYPANYGFIPRTLGEDGDPVDVLILSHADIIPLSLVRMRVLGVMKMIDGGEGDDKIIGVAADDVTVSHIQTMQDFPPTYLAEIEHFFSEYKRLEKKTVEVGGFHDKDTAFKIITNGIEAYKEKFLSDSAPQKRAI